MSPQVISYKKAVEQFIEEKEKARRKGTANAYKGLLNRLSFEDQVTAISHEEVARKLRRITTQGAYNHHLVALKVFFNWEPKDSDDWPVKPLPRTSSSN